MNYLRNLGVELKTTNSTAEAVEIVRELDNPSAGVIASEEAIKGYGLELLKCGVQDLKNNYSIFWELDTRERKKIFLLQKKFIIP